MRVAIVSESFLPHVNGVTNSVRRITSYLHQQGHEVLILAPDDGPRTEQGARVVRLPAVDFPLIDSLPVGWPSLRVRRLLHDFAPDVVHLASPFFLGWRAASVAKKLGIPTLAVYQTDVAGFAPMYNLGFLTKPAWAWIRKTHRLVARTLAPSTVTADTLRRNGVPRVRLWPRGVDSANFDPERRDAELRERLAPNGELLVGFVGRLAREKAAHRLAALAEEPGVRLVLVGDGPDREKLERTLPGAAFLGQLTGSELARAYASLDVFVHTGVHETFCQTVQEALASGVPAIAPDIGGPRDLIEHGVTGFLLDDAAFDEQLRKSIRTLADPEVRAEFSARARESVRERTWDAVCARLLEHYAEITGIERGWFA